MTHYILALDQGTSSSRAIIFDDKQNIIAAAQKEFKQYYPRDGWVEQNPWDIYNSQIIALNDALKKAGIDLSEIAAIGIANQRETTILWDKKTGQPVYNAIVWQCRRTAPIIEDLLKDGHENLIHEKTGLIPDPYFSASKIKWILDQVDGVREKAEKGDILFGTVDTWLLWQLSGGKVHATDYSNASRSMLYNINSLEWDNELLQIFDIPPAILPQVRDSSCHFCDSIALGKSIPICGVMGDQQAALFGQRCFNAGDVKNTYGTGCFLLMNSGKNKYHSKNGLITTIASGIKGEINYALEGSVFVAGAVVQWLRDNMEFFAESSESEILARSMEDNAGVYFVPAFTGLGAPYWNPNARGLIIGLTRESSKEQLVRAALESIAYQTYDLVEAMKKDTAIDLEKLAVDGGAARNNFLMQFQADILATKIQRNLMYESTALGAYYLAALEIGLFRDRAEILALPEENKIFHPQMTSNKRYILIEKWHKAVQRSLDWS